MDRSAVSQEPTSFCKIVKILASESNIHGISKIGKARSTPRLIFWFGLVVLANSFAVFQMSSLLQKYFSYPTTELITKSQKTRAAFPAVTLCNTNPISLTKINQMLINNSDLMSWFQYLDTTNFNDELKTKLQSHQAFYENLPEIAEYIAYSFDDLVLSCRFKNADCGIQNFSRHFDGKNYYNCFTFTVSNANIHESFEQNKAGIDNGLSLIISLGDRTWQPGTFGIYDIKNPSAFGLGIRAQIHEPNTRPTPFFHGFDVPPGFSTSVGVKANVYSLLVPPYSDCTLDRDDQTYKNTVFSCFQQCHQDILIAKCGCKTSSLPDAHNSNVPYCLQINNWQNHIDSHENEVLLEMAECEKKVMMEINSDETYENHCQCPEPCESTTYDPLISTSFWPDEFYQFRFLKGLYEEKKHSSEAVQEAFDTLNTLSQKYDNYTLQGMRVKYDVDDQIGVERASNIIRQNFMRLNVYFQDLRVTEYTLTTTYKLSNLLSDIAITMIVWLGFSMLSFMEVFELIMVLVMHVCRSHLYILGNKSG